MCLSVPLTIRGLGRCLVTCRRVLALIFPPALSCQTKTKKRLFKYLGREEEERQPRNGFIAWEGGRGGKPVLSPLL